MNQTVKTIFSARWNLIKIEFVKIARGFAIGCLGAICTYLETQYISDLHQALAVYVKPEVLPLALGFMFAINSSAVNSLHKLLSKTTYIVKQ